MIALLRALVATAGFIPWCFAAAHARPAGAVALFHGLCHQLPERTLSLAGVGMLVCSRCAGIYAGVALGTILPTPASWAPHGRRLLVVAGAALAADAMLQAAGMMPVFHPTRLATGLAAGWCASGLMFATLRVEARRTGPAGR